MRKFIGGGLLLPLLAACSSEAPAPEAPKAGAQAASLYQEKVAPLFRSKCAICHLSGSEAGNIQMTPDQAIAAIVGIPSNEAPEYKRVEPGDPDASYLVMKIEGTHIEKGGSGAQMPFGAPPLAPQEIADIRQWIKEGARP
jgi:mono/diheme cytochrome c family protein